MRVYRINYHNNTYHEIACDTANVHVSGRAIEFYRDGVLVCATHNTWVKGIVLVEGEVQ